MEKIRSRLIRHGTRRATLVVAVSQSCMPLGRDVVGATLVVARLGPCTNSTRDGPGGVSDLVNGRVSKFTLDKLVNMAARVGLNASITIEGVGNTDPAVPNATCSPP